MLQRIKQSVYVQHETKRVVLYKFIFAAFVLVVYGTIVFFRYGAKDGLMVAALTWSFFVLSTPIADAGFLLDFPLRLLIGVRMLYAEIAVWVVAISLNVVALSYAENIYSTTIILRMFKEILTNPIPFWAIIVVSAVGTFFSVYFGDELIDVAMHVHRRKRQRHARTYQFFIWLFILGGIVFLYRFLFQEFGINLL